MTIIDISKKDNAHRALLSEQYANVASIFKYVVNMFATEHSEDKKIELLDVTIKERDIQSERDLGYTTVKTFEPGRTLSLDFKSLLANNMLPSAVLDDEMALSLEFAGICFEHEECAAPIEVLFDFEEFDENSDIIRPAVIVVRMSEENGLVPIEDIYFIIGYIQFILSAAEAAKAIEEYENTQAEQNNN